ncbi:AAA family ATPase [Salinibacterium sp. SWN167]|uniref:AAA family ATPase n=1 Tax=Salinibacterium sp. SWN167 TaxID=2792054 RepID=UPI0018CD4827|nr:ATP-binding protein [Salinibacterium sp. SWN167]MBH0082227.1 AAA family ATPase [Salinibacterium sp. SWN167]
MTSSVRVPVDKDSAAPLATVYMPEVLDARLPLFPASLQENIDALVREWAKSDELLNAGLNPSQSLLIYGAPGTGKTTVAMWLAQQLQLPVVVARLDGLISSFLGNTARNLGSLFDFANRYECVLVLDEFDAIAKLRDDPNEVGEIKRVVNALLQNMDGREGKGITIGLTNHEMLLDPAIWRRFEVQLAVPLPGLEQRIVIADRLLDDGLAAEAKLIAWLCDGASGAEVQTMAMKYRKRRLLRDDPESAPIETALQVAQSTSIRVESDRRRQIQLDEAPLTVELATADGLFSHAELAQLFKCSTKTIQRRLSDSIGEGPSDGK